MDVSEKPVTVRQAVARGIITMNAEAFAAVERGTVKKGDVLGVARIAGIMATKRTSELIPLCHPLPLTKVSVDFTLLPERQAVEAVCTVKTTGVTGVEMEALTGVSTALLTIYDMCKAVDKALLAAGLDSVNISLDTLDAETFRRITARDELAHVLEGIRAALASGIPVKLNCVPQAGVNEGELETIAALAQEYPLQVRFIEMMPIGCGAALPCLSGPELLARLARRWPQLRLVSGAAFGDGPAVYYTAPGWQGSVGFIAAVHGKFCGSCNRVRLTSQGFLRPCLASETGTDLRALLRDCAQRVKAAGASLLRGGASDEQLLQAIREAVFEKPREHHFEDRSMPATRGMYQIGG